MGFNVTGTDEETATYTVPVPAGKTYLIIWRVKYKQWNVTQRKYYWYGCTCYKTWLNEYAHVYPYRFDTWSFNYREVH
jgi:hypothetical protein